MRRKLTMAIAASLLALVLPATASAHHAARHAAAHKARAHHRRRHRRAHTVVFSPAVTPGADNSETGTTTETPAGEAAGTVASYEGGVLKITLADGSTVSGKVTESTEIQCGCSGDHGGQNGGGDWQHGEGQDPWQGSDGGGEHGRFNGDDEQGGSPEESCGVSSLVPGAKVKDAELNITGAGAVWERVDLVPANAQQQSQHS